MTISRLCALAAAIIVTFCGCACHAQVIRVDPNAGSTAETAGSNDVDTRLARKVSYEAWHKPVKDILDDLSESTGVALYAGTNSNSWQVRDRKMNICVKDISLAQLMTSIARVMNFKWSKNDELDPPTYRLVTDYKLLSKLQAEASRRQNELKREESRRRTGLLQALAEVSNASGSELLDLKEENPYLYLCAETGFAKLMTQMVEEEPRIGEMFVQADKNLQPEISVFSADAQEMCAEVMRKVWPMVHEKGSDKGRLPDDLEVKVDQYPLIMGLIANPFEEDQRERLMNFGSIGSYIPMDHGYQCVGWLMDPNSKSTRAWAKAMVVKSDEEASETDISRAYEARWEVERKETRGIEYYLMYDPPIEHADEPELHGKVTVELSDEARKAIDEEAEVTGAVERLTYQALLKALGEAAEVSVITDSYAVVQEGGAEFSEDEALVTALDKLCDAYRCNWEKHADTIEVRRMDWFRRRASQVPDAWLEPCRKELQEEGMLTLLNYARMMTLSEEQLEENVSSDPVLRKAVGQPWEYASARGILRFYLQLTDSQREMIFSERGLDPHSLNATQWKYYTEMFHYGRRYAWGTEEFSDPGNANVIIKATGQPNQTGGIWYKFSVYLTEEDGNVKESPFGITVNRIGPAEGEAE